MKYLFYLTLLLNIPSFAATKDSSAVKTGYADVNGLRMYYEIHGAGNGVPLLLLHGGGSTIGTTFGRVLPALSAGRRVIAIELQGHGHTADRKTPFSFEQDADDAAALLSQLNVQQADVMGFSNGGNSAMMLAMRHPGKVRRLVVASVFYRKEGWVPGLEAMFRKADAAGMPPVLRNAYTTASPQPDPDTFVAKLMGRLLTFKDWQPDMLRAIKQPVLVLAGNHDVATMAHTVEMYQLFPNGQLAIFPGAHGTYLGEAAALDPASNAPARTAALVIEFLDAVAAK
ncbi:alpha/beta hydrolase [Chitinophaga caseinilytica]|uniref:Alpha/beta hydrolase n=1 Tax=Chitinophaga caseinilytica TaxID=2267521 RepID=A0ABZ2Z3S9_9BACT